MSCCVYDTLRDQTYAVELLWYTRAYYGRGAFPGTIRGICSGLELQQFGAEPEDFSDPRGQPSGHFRTRKKGALYDMDDRWKEVPKATGSGDVPGEFAGILAERQADKAKG
jgi:hypothetical protein